MGRNPKTGMTTRGVDYDARDGFPEIPDRVPMYDKAIGQSAAILDSDFIALVLVKDRHIVWANSAMQRLFGYQPGELVGQATRDMFLDQESHDAFDLEVSVGIRQSGTHHGEFALKRKDGSTGWFEFSISPLAGQPDTAIGAIIDRTARHESQAQLEIQAGILDSITDGVSIVSTDGIIRYTNAAFDAMFGYAAGELGGQPADLLDAPTDRSPAGMAREIMDAIGSRGFWQGEILNRRKDGSAFWTRARINSTQTSRYGPAWVSVRHDITRAIETERALQGSREALERAQAVAHIGSFAMGSDTEAFTCSRETARLFDLDASGATTFDEWFSRVHPDDQAAVEAAWRAALQGAPCDMSYRIVVRGEVVWIRALANLKFDDRGHLENAVGTVQDITTQKANELALRASEDRYRSVLQDQTEAISRFLPDGTFVFVNDVYCRMFGKRADELLGHCWHPVVHPDDLPMIEAKLRDMTVENPVVIIENRVCDARGEMRWMQFVNRGFYDAAGVLKEIQSVGRDITDLKQIEAILRESEERLEMALAGSGLAQWEIDQSSGYISFGRRLYEMLGYPPESAPMHVDRWRSMCEPSDLKRIDANLAAHLAGDTPVFHAEHRVRHKEGHWVTLEATGKTVRRDSSGKPLRIAGTLQDVSLKKRLNEEGVDLLKRIETLIHDATSGTQVRPEKDDLAESLTRRQRQILAMIASGMTSAEIGKQLKLSTNTVVSHRRNLMGKLKLHTTAEVTRFAVAHGLLENR